MPPQSQKPMRVPSFGRGAVSQPTPAPPPVDDWSPEDWKKAGLVTLDEWNTAKPVVEPAWSEGAGALPAFAQETVVPLWDAITHPIDTAKGVGEGIANFPAAFQAALDRNPGVQPQAVLAGMLANGMFGSTVENVTTRAKAGDVSGAVGAAAGGLVNLLPAGRAAQVGRAVGKPLRAVGRTVAGSVLDAVPAVAQQALDEGALRFGVGAGGRKIEAASQAAAARATATAPGVRGPGTGGVKFAAKEPKPRRPLTDPEGPNPLPMSPGYARQMDVSERATGQAGQAYTPAQTIRKAEERRQESLALARKTTRGDEGVRQAANAAEFHRGNVSRVLPAAGRAELTRIGELQPLAEALAHTQGRQALTGATPFFGPPLKMAHEVLSTGGGTIASGLEGAGKLSPLAAAQMQRAALLARLLGRDDDE